MHAAGAILGTARHTADTLSIRRTRYLADGLRERIGVQNTNPRAVKVRIELEFEASFQDMCAVRGYKGRNSVEATIERTSRGDALVFERLGRDGVRRTTEITMRPAPDAVHGNVLVMERELAPQGIITLELAILPCEDGAGVAPSPAGFDEALDALNARYRRFLRGCTLYATSSETLDDGLITPSALDLRALTWCDTYGDADHDGYVEYGHRPSDLVSQGWKDSANSLSDPDGTPSQLPAALVEVQAYVYGAKRGLADLYEIDGDTARAAKLRAEAAELRERFERDFWMDDEGCYAQALDGRKRQVKAVTSNAGHALWCGITARERAARVVHRLMAPDMYTGWGIRTLSSRYPTYNPISYHNGSVWPHDNSLIAHGFARYGFREEATEIVSALMEAGRRFPNAQLPELFCGFSRDLRFSSRPADYLVSCIPQDWSAGMVFLCLRTILGLEPDLSRQRVVIEPALPPWLERVDVRDLRAYEARVSFRVRRTAKGVRVVGGRSRVARATVATRA